MIKDLPEIIEKKKFDKTKYRMVFLKWMTGLFSIKPKNSKKFEFIIDLGLKSYKPPKLNFFKENIEIFSEFDDYYEKEYSKDSDKRLMHDWLKAAESNQIEVFRGFFKNFSLEEYKLNRIFNHKEKKAPKERIPLYYLKSSQGAIKSLRSKLINGESYVSDNILYGTVRLLKDLNFLEKKKFIPLGGGVGWRIKNRLGYVITIDFEREKFREIFEKLNVNIWDKPKYVVKT